MGAGAHARSRPTSAPLVGGARQHAKLLQRVPPPAWAWGDHVLAIRHLELGAAPTTEPHARARAAELRSGGASARSPQHGNGGPACGHHDANNSAGGAITVDIVLPTATVTPSAVYLLADGTPLFEHGASAFVLRRLAVTTHAAAEC